VNLNRSLIMDHTLRIIMPLLALIIGGGGIVSLLLY